MLPVVVLCFYEETSLLWVGDFMVGALISYSNNRYFYGIEYIDFTSGNYKTVL